MTLYNLDSMYPQMAEAVVDAVQTGRQSRWVATAAWWLGRQNIFSAAAYWQAVAAMVTNALSEDERNEIDTQLYKAELALLSTVSEYPALPEALAATLAGYAPATETADTTRQRYVSAIMAALNAKARERNYDSIATAVTYLNDANATFAAEAKALFDWRSAVWTYATDELAKVEAGGTIPTLDSFIAAMPVFEWPQVASTTEAAGTTTETTTTATEGASA